MTIYGIVAVVQAVLPVIIYITCAAIIPKYVAANFIVYVFQAIWWPFFLTWMAVVLFDSQDMRDLMSEALHISMAGPYLLYMVGLGDMWMKGSFTDWTWWIAMIFMVAYTAISLFYEAIFVPKVMRWIKSTPIKIYPAPDKKNG